MKRREHRFGRPLLGVMVCVAAIAAAIAPATAQPAPFTYEVLPVGPGGAPVFVGTAEPGVTVELLDGAVVIAAGTANERGEWMLMAPGPAGPAGTFTVRVTSPNGTVETAPPHIVGEPPATPLTVTLADGTAAGTAAPAATIAITGLGEAALTAIADGAGQWIIPLPALPAGAYALRVTAADGAAAPAVVLDLVLPLAPENLRVEVTVAAPAFAAAEGTLAGPRFVVVGPRDTLWDIAIRAYGDGLRYREIFSANRDQLRDPRRIFAGQVLLIP